MLTNSKWIRKSNTENSKPLVFVNLAETFKKVLNLATLLFEPPISTPFLRDLFLWMSSNEGTNRKIMLKKKVLQCFFDNYEIAHTFSRKDTWTLSSFPTPLEKRPVHSVLSYCRCGRCKVMISNNQQAIILQLDFILVNCGRCQ